MVRDVAGGAEHHPAAADDVGEERRDGRADAGAGEGRGRQYRLTARGGVVWSPHCAGGRLGFVVRTGGCGMTGWDIKPQGVQGQLKVVGVHAGELEKALNALLVDLGAAARAAGTVVPGGTEFGASMGPVAPGLERGPVAASVIAPPAMGPVASALGEYAKARKAQLKSMSERIQAAVLGAATATNEYVEGDLDTAKQAQNAAKSVRLDLLKELRGAK
ncbi:predicted protein [Streptomyces filamentosus NRRL 15998]|uniref:Predicted protein n=1 Tax=Streptomyces filamentosus NRRL 15998 TaxID=457431 RepID=D6AEG1_STRFL|nr:predicted protein [Streptomyces filamentosus NRRL 15998]